MFEKWKRKKAIRQKIELDVQSVFSTVNKIKHKYSGKVGLADIVGFYTLTVAYGVHVGKFDSEELPDFKNHLYTSSLTQGMSSAQRGVIVLEYDRLMAEHFEYFSRIESNDIKPRIKEMLEKANSMNMDYPEYLWSTDMDELEMLEGIIDAVA